MNKSESKYFNTAVKFDKALLSLLKKKPFEYITVCEICKQAGVNRSTFYLHYETVGDLLNETTRYVLKDFLSYFSAETKSIARNLKSCELDELIFVCDKYLTPYLTYIEAKKEIFSTVLRHNKTLGFEDVYQRMFDNIFNPILDRFHYPTSDRRYVMMYYLNGITAIITEWLKDDCKKSTAEISEIIQYCIFGRMK
ncbi:MAG: TetR family transcriptional regulator C-terminal domain-containing protein [Clostridia bacterium]|nr:TetR family transcriptional regulator C-terminal domain-containing protein [Clostridia bacterium]